jgi:hypothetical protein
MLGEIFSSQACLITWEKRACVIRLSFNLLSVLISYTPLRVRSCHHLRAEGAHMKLVTAMETVVLLLDSVGVMVRTTGVVYKYGPEVDAVPQLMRSS